MKTDTYSEARAELEAAGLSGLAHYIGLVLEQLRPLDRLETRAVLKAALALNESRALALN